MFQFFDAIISIISTVINFVVGIVEMVVNLVQIIFKGTAFLFAIIPNLPPFCVSFVTVMISVAILLQVLNKGG